MKINKIALIASIFFIVVACQAVYYNALETEFQFDDSWQVQDNYTMRNLGQTASTLLSEPRRYVTRLSYALNYYFTEAAETGAPPSPKPFHLVNNIIHAINGVLVFFLTLMFLARLVPEKKPEPFQPVKKKRKAQTRGGGTEAAADERARGRFALLAAFFAGTIFVLHPLFSEGVTYVSGRSSSLCTTFCLLSIVLYLLARRFGERRWFISAVYFAIFSFVAFVLSLLTKENGLVTPVLIVLVELCVLSRGRLRSASGGLRAWPYFSGFVLVFVGVVAWVFWRLAATGTVTANEGFFSLSYLLAQTEIVVRYAWMLLIPVGLNIDHTWPQFPDFGLRFVPYILILLAALAFGAVAFRRARRAENPAGWTLAFLAVAWFFVALAPTSSVIGLGDWMVERRVYMAGVLPVMCAGCAAAYVVLRLLTDGGWRRSVVVAVMLISAVGLGACTALRNADYRTQMSLWMPAMKERPTNFRMCDSVALCWMLTASDYYSEGRYRQGLAALRNSEGMIGIAERNPFLRGDQHMYLLRARSDLSLLSARGMLWLVDSDDPAEVRRIERLYERALGYARESRLYALQENMWVQRLECTAKIITAALQLGIFDFKAWCKYSKEARETGGDDGAQVGRLAESYGNKAHIALRYATGQFELYVADWPVRVRPHYAERRARFEAYLAYRLLIEYYGAKGLQAQMNEVLHKATSLGMSTGRDVGELMEYYNRSGAFFGGERRLRR